MTLHEFPLLAERYFEEVLPGSLRIRVIPRPGFAHKLCFLGVNYGSVDTRWRFQGEYFTSPNGVAHYLEHKMFDTPDGGALGRFAALGGSDNAFTGYNMTAYYVDCTDRLEENLRLLLEMVATPYFTRETVEKERGIIEQEIRMYEDSPSSAVYEQLFEAMLRQHPARVPVAGTVESIAEITEDTLQKCYDAFYTPENMMLCVVGDVDPESIVRLAAEIFPPRPSLPRPATDYGQHELLTPAKSYAERAMEVSMPGFQIGFACVPPAPGKGILQQEITAELAVEALLGEDSQLYTDLYERGLIDSGFSSGYEEIRGFSLLSAGGDSDEPKTVLAEILKGAERLQQEGIGQERFERMKRSAIGSRIRELDSFDSIAYRLCAYYFEGAEYYDFPELYAAVTEENVLALLRETVRPERATLSVILPLEKGREA